jgi:hypothetical protein
MTGIVAAFRALSLDEQTEAYPPSVAGSLIPGRSLGTAAVTNCRQSRRKQEGIFHSV